MSNKDYPAYPLVHGNTVEAIDLTKRELIAAMAMQGLCANSEPFPDELALCDVQSHIAKCAVGFADALLEALK